MSLGERLKMIREKRGLSQSDLAKLVKIHPHHLSRCENERSLPSINTFKKLSAALQVSTDYLLFNGKREEKVEFDNPVLKERFLLISKMNKKDQEAITRILDGMIIKNKIKGEITPHLTED